MLANNPSVLTGGGVATNLVNGTGLFANGTAAAPSISFASATGLGFYEYNSTTLGLAMSGAQKFLFNSAGEIIGPNISGALRLDTAGYITLTAAGTNQNITLTPSGTGFAQIGSASGTLLLVGTGTNSSNGAIQLATHTTSAGGIGFGTDTSLFRANNGRLALNGTGAGFLYFYESGAEKGYVGTVSGDVYFGTSTAKNIFLQPNGVPALTLDASQNSTFGGIVIHKSYTVATLPAAAAGNTYGIVFVSDATNAAGTGIGTAPTGGGAIKRAVYSTGAAWLLL